MHGQNHIKFVFDSLHNATDLYIRGVISLIQMF